MWNQVLGLSFCAVLLAASPEATEAQAFFDSQAGPTAGSGQAFVSQLGTIVRPPTAELPPQQAGVATPRVARPATGEGAVQGTAETPDLAQTVPASPDGTPSRTQNDVILNCGNNGTPCVVPEGVPLWPDL